MKRISGFTLLELLIGMTILGFMLVLLFSGFRLATDTMDRTDSESHRTTEQLASRQFLRRVISTLQPMRWKQATDQPLAFVGDHDGLRGLSQISTQAGLSGLRVVEIVSIPSSSPGQRSAFHLQLRQAAVAYDAVDFSEPLGASEPKSLLRGFSEIEFSYYGIPKRGEPAQWFETWSNQEQLPTLIRIRLRSEDGEWGDLSIVPQVNGLGCHWNSFYKKCMSR